MAWRYRLYPNPTQTERMERHCADARFVWNLALEQISAWRPGRQPPPGSAERFRQLTDARKGFCVRDVSVRRLSRKWAEILVPKCGPVRFRLTRPLGPHGMARITRDGVGRWHVAFSAPQPGLLRQACGKVVGVDLGVANTVTTSDGESLQIPGLRPSEERRLVHLQRKLARQQRGSQRRARTKHALAVLHARAADRRRDWAEKTSTDLVQSYDVVVFEDLRVQDMLRSARGTLQRPGRNVQAKAGLNRRIAGSAWATLVRRTRQKAEASGGEVVLVDPRHTSQTCSACGHVAAENRPTRAIFACQVCGHGEHADINAARNIRARGLRVSARGGRPEVGAPCEARTTRPEAA